jgi:F-type H+-transporting ATPase subunit epsilon
MPASLMTLKILLPFGVFAEKTGVARIVVETQSGSLGLLPHRLDCVAALTPGILTYETEHEREVFVAVDEGVMIKAGPDVLISVRRALSGGDLSRLHHDVESEFLNLGEAEQSARLITAKLESDFLRRFAGLQHD